jgi:assimilatory nitrate reductase catalytic subunit
MVARVRIGSAQRNGELFAPMHWNSVFARQGKINALVEGRRDPLSGQPESKQTAARLMPWQPEWQGELYCREILDLPGFVYWWRKAATGVNRLSLAADKPLLAWLMNHCAAQGWQLQIARSDTQSNLLAWYDGELMLGFWSGAERPELAHQVIGEAFDNPPQAPEARHALLSGKGTSDGPAQGRTVCSCFSVGEIAIRQAIEAGCDSVAALGAKLRCGTNCGSCIPELKGLLAQRQDIPENSP